MTPGDRPLGATETVPGLLLDVDGTLLDTNYLHTLAWSRALEGAVLATSAPTDLLAGHLDPERSLVVGDSIWDVQAARAAGVGCIVPRV